MRKYSLATAVCLECRDDCKCSHFLHFTIWWWIESYFLRCLNQLLRVKPHYGFMNHKCSSHVSHGEKCSINLAKICIFFDWVRNVNKVLCLKWSDDIVLQVAMCLLSGHHLYSVTTTPGTPGLQSSHWPPAVHVSFWLAEMARCLWPLYGVTTQLWTYLLSQVISSIII